MTRVDIGVIIGGTRQQTHTHTQQGSNKMDRSEISRALAKAIAYKNCGKDKEAEEWARKLIELLKCENILK